jgi:beta-galactosidase/beta-glucuronidase
MTKHYKENYPRPQFVRDSYLDLNGKWNFRFDDRNEGLSAGWQNGFEDQKILVPYSYESKRSGIGCEEVHEVVWYSRKVNFASLGSNCKEGKGGQRILLNFEGSDYKTELWVNGIFLGSHEGGYTRFTFDITDTLSEDEGMVVIRVNDSLSTVQPRGKQRWLGENFDCWYVQTTGIWKSLWAEKAGNVRLEHLHMIPRYDDNAVDFEYTIEGGMREGKEKLEVETVITFNENIICSQRDLVVKKQYSKRFSLVNDNIKWKVKYWCPKSPHLYDVCIRIYEDGILRDEVGSYFGLRKISTDSSRVKLNNMDYYLRLILDQGYWEDTDLTPPDEEAIKKDIDKILAYGYNGVRKHQKIEDERFYYWADVKGLLVWCEAPSFYELNGTAVENVTREWIEIVKQHYNHPSIITWVPFNESWGIPRVIEDKTAQNLTESIYHMTKTLDDTRPVVSNDGWEHTKTDIITLHDYASNGDELKKRWLCPEENLENKRSFNGERYAFAKGYRYAKQPIIISEFGGIAYDKKNDGWGYGNVETKEDDFLERLKGLMEAVYDMEFICGFCYTQLTDVQQEQNGHMYMDRKDKIAPQKISEIIKGL